MLINYFGRKMFNMEYFYILVVEKTKRRKHADIHLHLGRYTQFISGILELAVSLAERIKNKLIFNI